MLERPLRGATDEGPAYGAALLASVGAGTYATVDEAVAAFARYRAAYPASRASGRDASNS